VTLQSLNGYLQHVMENRPVAALTDITARCAVQASTAVAAN
jgi:Na+/phosphate symporter